MSLADDILEGAPGVISKFAGLNLPPGYLWANGAAVSRTTYARLFAALAISVTGTLANGSQTISSVSQDLTQLPTSVVGAPISGNGIPVGAIISAVTSNSITLSLAATASNSGVAVCVAPYGVGDGATTFNVPDHRGRVGVGHDLMGTAAAGRITSGGSGVNGALLGASGGAETVTLSTAQMPAHTHANTLTDNGHQHQLPNGINNSASGGAQAGSVSGAAYSSTGLSTVATTTGITLTNASQGSGNAHNNAQPSIVMNFIIKT
jgi:microcystin-dependent protein